MAVQEILAVVETTVSGYESDFLSLKQELGQHQKQLHALLPQVTLIRIGSGDGGEEPHISSALTAENKDEARNKQKNTEIEDCRASEECETENGVCGATLFERESEREEGLGDEAINNVQDTKVKRKRRLPGRYRDGEKSNEDKRTVNRIKRRSNMKKIHRIRLKMGLMKNCPETEPSDKDGVLETSFKTVMCSRLVSEPDFRDLLSSTFPELQGQTFEAFLADDKNPSAPRREKRVTLNELHKTFRSQRQRQFVCYLQIKESEDVSINATTTEPQPTKR